MFKPKEHFKYTPLSGSCADLKEKDVGHLGSHHAEGEGGKAPGSLCAGPGRGIAHRVKKSRVMRWLILHSDGTKQQMCLDKRQLIQHFHLDIPTRDMRLMDSTLMGANYTAGKDANTVNPNPHHQGAASSAAQLLVRDNALVLCMEHVRMIITADKVLIPLEDDRSEMNERFNLHIEQVVQEWLGESAPDSVSSQNTLPHPQALHPGRPFHHAPPLHPPTHPPTHLQQQQQQQPRRTASSLMMNSQQQQQQQLPAQAAPHAHQGALRPRVHRRSPSTGAPISNDAQTGVQGRVTPSRGSSPVEQAPPSYVTTTRHYTGQHPQGPDPTYPVSHDGDSHSLGSADGTKVVDGIDGPLLMTGTPSQRGDEELPFELAMLETGLGEACSFLAREADLLQAQSTPALEDLIANSDKNNLERVRRVKTAHQRLLSRVLTVREALHRLMEDDTDMWRMCLTKHASYKALAAANASAEQEQQRQGAVAGAEGGAGVEADSPLIPGNGSVRTPSLLAMKLRQVERAKNVTGDARLTLVAPDIAGSPSIENLDEDDWHDLLDVENLLEAYFTIADSTQTTLAGIGEYIDDTEDLVNINLDNSRNKLIRFEILLTTGTFALSSYSVVAGILGENLVLPDFITRDISGFVFVNGLLVIVSTIIFFTIYKALKSRKLV